jgi:hypothetical protein
MDTIITIIQKLATDSPEIFIFAFCFFTFLFKEQIIYLYRTKIMRGDIKEEIEEDVIYTPAIPVNSGLNFVHSERRKLPNTIYRFLKQTFVYYFDETIHIPDLEQGIKDLEGIIDSHRQKQQRVVFDLTKTLILIEYTQEMFSTVLKRIILNNNINFLVIFPNLTGDEDKYRNMTDLIESIVEYNTKHTTEATKVKVEDNVKNIN